MESASIYILIILYVIAFLVAAFALKKYQRAILWTGALILFFSTMLLVGLGLYIPKGLAGVLQPCLALVVSGLMVLVAEKQNSIKLANDANHKDTSVDNAGDEESFPIPLPKKLNTKLAKKIFMKAKDAGFIEIEGGKMKWKKSIVLLAYMCGRIYCGDTPQYFKREQCNRWRFGKSGRFPDRPLQTLFEVKSIGQLRLNGRNMKVPDGSDVVDSWFV